MLGFLGRVGAAVVFSGVTVTWATFKSPTYPYTILQPSSYKFTAIDDLAGKPVDYFFPSLGSGITYVSVSCEHKYKSAWTVFHSNGAKHVQPDGRILIDGTWRALTRGDFEGLLGRWTEEQAVFTAHGRVWRVTASWAMRFRSQRPVEMRMLRSFKPS
jgi:hypothetical protein